MDNADEQAVRKLGLSHLVSDWNGKRVIWCNSIEESVQYCVEINNLYNSILLQPGTDPMLLHIEKLERKARWQRHS